MDDLSRAPGEERLRLRSPAPDWFQWAVSRPRRSHLVPVEGCDIHYLQWAADHAAAEDRSGGGISGLLFVHGGGAHANWWSFIAPFFTDRGPVAAMDLSGMGDSGRREDYNAELRAYEIRDVVADAGLGPRPVVVGHSFGGYMTMKFGRLFGERVAGAVIVDSPIRPPDMEAQRKPRRMTGPKRVYGGFEEAVSRFRLMPAQDCENDFIVEHIARHSLMAIDEGWTWKFHEEAMGAKRFSEPFREHLMAMTCRRAYFHGADSALVTPEVAAYTRSLLGRQTPMVEIAGAQHHVMLDQPLAFVAALRTLLAAWDSEVAASS
jgi:pimeloyl-ACP methyl ester carboxylesterase